jgi:hypothetical protein
MTPNDSAGPPVALGGMQPGLVPLHVVWPKPTLMIPMGSVLLWVDGRPVWRGPFEHGVDVSVPVLPGKHRLEVKIDVEGMFSRTRGYDVEVSGAMRLDLTYSRFWGNFSKKVGLRPGA